MSERTPRVAILASGGGSTAEAFIRGTQEGRVNAEVGLVICNNPPEKAGVYDRVDRLNQHYGLDIEAVHMNGIMYPSGQRGRGQTLEESEAIADRIRRGGYDHVALMGYMKMVRGALIDDYGALPSHGSIYEARMTNTHPGPLPETADTYGLHASERVLTIGMKATRHTVHLVSEGIDQGSIVSAIEIPVHDGDTAQVIFDHVQAAEKTHLQFALDAFLHEQRLYQSQGVDFRSAA